ncbi:MAG TPA: glucose 1-dehydrogenase [Gammaproteobacteria bacterium]|nr:glucose 1-dehydrogenase [Gammaproteobacteria bacterium]
MPRLEQKTAVVTGASSGIGRGIAMTFARECAAVVVNYKQSHDRAGAVVDEITAKGGKAVALQADVSSPDAIEEMITAATRELGGIDIWVNNAGADILTGAGAQLNRYEKLQQLIDVDLKGTINCCWAVVPHMQERGHGAIVNMAWDLAVHGFEGVNPQMFAAVKAGVLGFSRSLAKSVGPEIRVNVVAPGWIETAFAEEVMDRDYYDARIREIPAGRFGRPEDVAEAALFLVSDEASYITGEMIKINGGLS